MYLTNLNFLPITNVDTGRDILLRRGDLVDVIKETFKGSFTSRLKNWDLTNDSPILFFENGKSVSLNEEVSIIKRS